MSWLEWLRLAAEVIALVITWLAGRKQLERAVIRRAQADVGPRTGPTNVPALLAVLFPRRHARLRSRRRKLYE